MKTKLFSLLLAVAASVGTMFAEKVQIGDLYYNLNETDKTAEVISGDYSGLTTANIPASVTYSGTTYSVTSIGNDAFRDCSRLTSIVIPNSVTSIGSYAFTGCCSLTSVTIPNSVTSIGRNAFSGCSGLTSVTIPNSVTSIGDGAFWGCSGLTSISVATDNPNYSSKDGVLFNKQQTALIQCPGGMQGEYVIPNSVTSIGYNAFFYCSSLTSVTIPNSVTSIGGGAFISCIGLISIVIPNSVTSIGDWAFYECSSLTSVTIPNSVTSIGEETFYGCSSLTSIYVPCGEMERFKQMLGDYSSYIKYAPYPYTITTNAQNGYISTTNFDNYTICDEPPFVTCTPIPDYGYHFTQWSDGNTDNPREIVLTQDTAFTAEFAVDRSGTCGNDYALTWSYNPTDKCLTIQGSGAFDQHIQYGVEAPGNMEKLIVSEGVTTIGASAFAYQATLLEVSLPTTLQTIGEQAFYNCTGLTHIYNFRERPCVAYSNSFDGIDKFNCTLHVLSASVDMYKAATAWRDFYYIQTIDATETTVATDKVSVEPTATTADVTWPAVENAATYELVIKDKSGNVVCTLIFNANGQLTEIAFNAPARDNAAQATGFSFTVTGLEEGTSYDLTITAKDSNGTTLDEKTIAFSTSGWTGVDALQAGEQHSSKILRDGEVLILRDGKTYTIQGVEVK